MCRRLSGAHRLSTTGPSGCCGCRFWASGARFVLPLHPDNGRRPSNLGGIWRRWDVSAARGPVAECWPVEVILSPTMAPRGGPLTAEIVTGQLSQFRDLAPSGSFPAGCHFPGSPVIDSHAPNPRRTRAKEGLSSSHDTCVHVPRPLRRWFFGTRSKIPGAFHGLRPADIGLAASGFRSSGAK